MKNDLSQTLFIPCKDNSKHSLPQFKSVYFTVDNKPFRIYTIFFTGSKDKLTKELKKHENVEITGLVEDEEKTFSGITVPCTTMDGHSFVLIWMPKFNWTLEDMETLSHECLHATIMVMRMSGVKSKIFSAEDDANCDDEGICYSQSSMFSAILSQLIKKQNKLFKKKIDKTNKK